MPAGGVVCAGANVGALSVLDSGGVLDAVVEVVVGGRVDDVVVVVAVVEGLEGTGLLAPLPRASSSRP